ncbi:MAG: hypothetical protein ACLFML_06995 [Desulfobacterales bacterium]
MGIKDSLLVCFAWICALITLAAVCSLLAFIIWQGGTAIEPALFFGNTPIREALTGQAPVWDGLWPACAGTLVLVFLAAGLALPFGLGTASLDFRAGRRIEDLLLNLAASYPMLVVSHSPGQAGRLAGAAVIFESGRIIHRLEKESIHRHTIEECIDGSVS